MDQPRRENILTSGVVLLRLVGNPCITASTKIPKMFPTRCVTVKLQFDRCAYLLSGYTVFLP